MHTCKDCQQTCVWDSMSLYYMQLISKPCIAVKSFEFSLSMFSARKKLPLKKPSALFKGSVSPNFIGTPVGWKCFIKSMAITTYNNYSKYFFTRTLFIHWIPVLSSTGQIVEDGKGLNLEKITQHFQAWVQYILLIPKMKLFLGKFIWYCLFGW